MKKTILAAAVVAVIGGTSVYAAGNSNDVQTADLEETNSTQNQQTDENSGEEQISSEEAVKQAQTVIDGTLDEVELDTEDGRLVYEVELDYQGEDYDFDIDAYTGEVVNIDDDLLGTEASAGAAVSLEEAEKTALAAFSGGKVDDSELEKNDGRLVYEIEVEINDEDGDVYIDAESGEILHIESDIAAFADTDAGSGSGNERRSAGDEQREGNDKDNSSGQITAAEAKEIAMDYAGGGYIDDMELEHEDGMLLFEVEVEYGADNEVEVYIDAYTGEILYVDKD
ncbi:PepSY domain-containing protein [Alkalicoccus halolimnae]|uniref:PepSY domain-containing protein n=1 Tax=Alkalicoccus halolimnae TaxID=1667239 RepID=A0AAJ8LXE7_9BACI|nr:PepSY domain-containing protein [Alkalicoccus halolimnae]